MVSYTSFQELKKACFYWSIIFIVVPDADKNLTKMEGYFFPSDHSVKS